MISDLLNLNEENIRSLSPAEKSAVLRILNEIRDNGRSDTYRKILQEDYDEIPVSIDEFIESDEYVGKTTQNGKNVYPYWRAKMREFFSPKNNYQEIILTGCLTGDTKIPLLNGTNPSILDLYNKHKFNPRNNGKDTIEYVYSYDTSSEEYTVGEMVRVFYTGKNPVYEITLDNGERIRATSNHHFMTRDKRRKSIDEGLSVGDSLMPFNRYEDDNGYEHIYSPKSDGSLIDSKTHRISMKYKRGSFKGVVHHKNFNKRNNDPTNLLLTNWISHRMYHAYKGKEVLDTWRRSLSDEEYKIAISKRSINALKSRYSKAENIEERRILMRSRNINGLASYASRCFWNSEKGKKRKEYLSEYSKKFNSTDHPNLLDISRQEVIDVLNNSYTISVAVKKLGISRGGLYSICKRYDIDINSSLMKSKINLDKSSASIISKLNELYSIYHELSDDMIDRAVSDGNLYNKLRRRHYPSSLCEKYGISLDELLEIVINYNHKIIDIRYVGVEDTYNVTVRDSHNFAISQGIVSFNSIGVGKTTIAILGMTYCLYSLMCLKNPQAYYGLQGNSKIVFAFFNINLDLSFGVAYKKLQSMLIESPWFLKNGTLVGREDRTKQYVPNKGIVFRVGSQPEHGLGQDIFCVTGDTEIMTDLGYEKIEDLEDKPIYAVTYDSRTGMLRMSNMTTVKRSGYTSDICVINLENGTCIKCTPDHKFMLSNGEYRMAKDLSPDDDIMSI